MSFLPKHQIYPMVKIVRDVITFQSFSHFQDEIIMSSGPRRQFHFLDGLSSSLSGPEIDFSIIGKKFSTETAERRNGRGGVANTFIT